MNALLDATGSEGYNPNLMAMVDTLFRVEIASADRGLTRTVLNTPAGSGPFPFITPLLQELDADLPPRQIGTQLFQSLLGGEMEQLWRSSLDSAYRQRKPLQLQLCLPELSSIRDLPWELLYDPILEGFIALDSRSPIVRFSELKHQIRPLPVDLPLRMLWVAAEPGGRPSINLEARWLALYDLLEPLIARGSLIVERLFRPTLFDLQRRLRRQSYQIIHFAAYSEQADGEQVAEILLEDEIGHSRAVSGAHLGAIVNDHYAARLVILESCALEAAATEPLFQVAEEMIPRGIPAALAFPAGLPYAFTLQFLEPFYASLLAMRPLPEAVVEARIRVAGESGPGWNLPRLYTRMSEGYLFDDGSLPPPPQPVLERRMPSLLERILSSDGGGSGL